MTVSVIIPAYSMSRWNTLVGAVHSCETQTVRPDEIIVIIDYNEELLARARHTLTGAKVIANESTKGVSGARNTGVAVATGDIIASLDDDAFAEPDWLENLIAPFEDPSVAGVGGWIYPHWPTSCPEWFPETFYWILGCSYAGLPETGAVIRNAIGANMAMRRRVFDLVGGFTEGIGRVNVVPGGCEETEIAIRYTLEYPNEKFVMNRDAVASQWVPTSRLTWHYFWSRCWSEGVSKANIATLIGTRHGLSAEREHLLRAIPGEAWLCVRRIPRDPLTYLRRLFLIVAGSIFAGAGFYWGRTMKRHHLESFSPAQLEALAESIRAKDPT